MMLSLIFFSLWLILKGAHAVRPSALQRLYAHIWLFTFGWAILVLDTILVDRLRLAFGYPFVFLQSSIFLSTFIGLCELFALPTKSDFAQKTHDDHQIRDHLAALPQSDTLITPSPGEMEHTYPRDDTEEEEPEPADETTPLRRDDSSSSGNLRMTFATTYRKSVSAVATAKKKIEDRHLAFEEEQAWSSKLPSWTWFLQFLILVPINVILWGQLGLFIVAAMKTTAADGGSSLGAYLMIFSVSILLLLPLTPFIHRVSSHIALFLLVIFIGTFIYNLVAFPFSADNRYKVYFQQTLNVDDGKSLVKLTGLEEYVKLLVPELPSSAGKSINRAEVEDARGLTTLEYDGSEVLPNVVKGAPFANLMSLNISRPDPTINKATFSVSAKSSKMCYFRFNSPISKFNVHESAGFDTRFGPLPDSSVEQLTLWSRDWDKIWTVDIEWKDSPKPAEGHADKVITTSKSQWSDELKARNLAEQGTRHSELSGSPLSGKLICSWSDANEPGTIPAFDECLQYAPVWVSITKSSVGLVEGIKEWQI
jgi:hypothetical protein